MAIIETTRIVLNLPSFIRCRVVGLVHWTGILLLQSEIVLLSGQALWIRILAVWAHILIVLSRLVRIVGLLLQRRPALLTDQRVAILLVLLRIILEESGGRR